MNPVGKLLAGSILGLCLVPLLPVGKALASPHHAHWHYLIGARANAGRSFATQIHHEAVAAGPLHLEPARVNASDMARLAQEIVVWVDALETVSSDQENALIQDFTQGMRTSAQNIADQATELLAWIEQESEASAEITETDEVGRVAVREQIAIRAAALYHGFGEILKAHKGAELALGIPVPAAPTANP